MLSIYDENTAASALNQPLPADLRELIEYLLEDAKASGLAELTHITVVREEDEETALAAELGWSPLIDPLTESRFGEGDFRPYWAWLEDVGGWFELLHTVGNSGFAYILLIEKGESELGKMCAWALTQGIDL